MKGKHLLGRIIRDTRAATAVEYALLVGLLMLAIQVSMNGFADQVKIMWNSISTTLANGIAA